MMKQKNLTFLVQTTTSSVTDQWPHLSTLHIVLICVINIGLFFLTWLVLRVIWKPPKATSSNETTKTVEDQEKQPLTASNLEESKEALEKEINGKRDIYEGDVGGDYSKNWIYTFDMVFLISMFIALIVLIVVTLFIQRELFGEWMFWLEQFVIIVILLITLFIGGLICRHFCQTDEHGYIITNRYSPFKVNYTKKLHHFTHYITPLVLGSIKRRFLKEHVHRATEGTLLLALNKKVGFVFSLSLIWRYFSAFVVMILLIKPLRERIVLFMIAFNAMDRPEDRPNTLLWTVAYNNIPAAVITIFFRWLYIYVGDSRDLAYIFTMVNVVGDGLAEPIGIYFGKHRYKTRGCFNKTAYRRSFEGSSCVLLSTVVFISCFYYAFKSALQFYITIFLLPPIMALTEATSPHTCDSAFIHFVGGLFLFIVVTFVP